MATKDGVQTTEDTSTHRPIIFYDLDNLGERTAQSHFDGDTIAVTTTGGVPQKPSSGLLRAYQQFAFDDQQRLYQTSVYSVDQSTGTLSSTALVTNTYYAMRGQLVIKTSSPGGMVTKSAYDGAGRLSTNSVTDGGGDSGWSSASTLTGNAVLEQTLFAYDGASNRIMTTTKQRFHDETATGALGNATSSPKARVSFDIFYYDALNRETFRFAIGTNGGSAYTRPTTPPVMSDTILMWRTAYSFTTNYLNYNIDARNTAVTYSFDDLGEKTTTREAYDGTVNGGSPFGANNRVTRTTYNAIGKTTSLEAQMPTGTNSQYTGYVYGVTQSTSALSSNDLLATVEYPNKTTGAASTLSQDQDSFTYDALGEITTKTDGQGSTHTYNYDVLGRVISDTVTTLGTSVDGTVRRIDTAYDTGDRPYLFTSYSNTAGTIIVNQVQRVYNGLSQLITEYQAVTGAVSTTSSPKVQWSYNLMAGGANNSRLLSITYPNGRVLNYSYNTGLDTTISRISYLSDNAGSSAGVHLEDYSYLGKSTIVLRHHPEPGVDYTFIKQGSESTGDAGDQYTGLDRFGRLVDCRWLTTSTGNPTDRFQYGYDRIGDVLYQNNLINSTFSILYHANGALNQSCYDPLNRMTAFARGTLSASGSNGTTLDTITTINHPSSSEPVSGSQSWTLDQLNNWSSFITDGTTDTRTHNAQNQVTATSIGTIWYYNNGSIIKQYGIFNTFDAWDRGTNIRGSTFSYDALGRRITESDSSNSQYFYLAGQKMIENSPISGATVRHQQLVYGLAYIDQVILRDRDADNNSGTGSLGATSSGLEERLYYEHDREYNVTSLVSQTGTVEERCCYDPYGSIQYFTAAYGSPSASSSYANQVGFTGRWLDATGMWYFRARYYEPVLGRFISRDPMGDVNGENLYCPYFVPGGRDPTGTRLFGQVAKLFNCSVADPITQTVDEWMYRIDVWCINDITKKKCIIDVFSDIIFVPTNNIAGLEKDTLFGEFMYNPEATRPEALEITGAIARSFNSPEACTCPCDDDGRRPNPVPSSNPYGPGKGLSVPPSVRPPRIPIPRFPMPRPGPFLPRIPFEPVGIP
jgi:RHS repeat-associated protein